MTRPTAATPADLDRHARVHALGTRAFRVQAQMIQQFDLRQLAWMRWHMTEAVMAEFAAVPVTFAHITAFTPGDPPTLFGVPIKVIEQADGEPAPWGLYLGVAA